MPSVRWFIPFLLLFGLVILAAPGACRSTRESEVSPLTFPPPELERHEETIRQKMSDYGSIQSITGDQGILRVDLQVTGPEGMDVGALKRRTLNAMSALQGIAGDEYRLSVWVWPAEGEKASRALAMAFYSPLTEEIVYKSGEELK